MRLLKPGFPVADGVQKVVKLRMGVSQIKYSNFAKKKNEKKQKETKKKRKFV